MRYARMRGVAWERYEPVWWLLSDADGPDASRSEVALAELLRRADAKILSDDQIRELADRALARQTDFARPWVTDWGTLIQRLRAAGDLPDEAWERYAWQSVNPGLQMCVQPYVRRGDKLAFSYNDDKYGLRRGTGRFRANWTVERVEVDGVVIETSHRGYPPEALFSIGPDIYSSLPDGPHRLQVTSSISVHDGSAADQIVHRDRHTSVGEWSLYPKGAPRTLQLHDPHIGLALSRAVRVVRIVAYPAPHEDLLEYTIEVDKPMAAVAARIFFRFGGRETEGRPEHGLGELRVQGGRSGAVYNKVFVGTSVPPKVDVVLRPAVDAARYGPFWSAVWGEDIILHDVPVLRGAPVKQGHCRHEH